MARRDELLATVQQMRLQIEMTTDALHNAIAVDIYVLVFGSLILGATFFIYDGAPDYPNPDRLWKMVSEHKITALGVSPTLIRSLIAYGVEPFKKHDLSSLRFFASTGEPWNPDPWMWLFDKVGEGKRPIINYSGGTEISGNGLPYGFKAVR